MNCRVHEQILRETRGAMKIMKKFKGVVLIVGVLVLFTNGAEAQVSLRPDRIETNGAITFESGTAQIQTEAFRILDAVAQQLRDRPDLRIEVQVHSDSRGSSAFNLRQSQERANAILAYLVQAGVPADHLSAQGFGETCPIASNQTAAGRAQNRRVIFFRLDSGQPRNCPIPAPPPPPEPDQYSDFPDPDDAARQQQ